MGTAILIGVFLGTAASYYVGYLFGHSAGKDVGIKQELERRIKRDERSSSHD